MHTVATCICPFSTLSDVSSAVVCVFCGVLCPRSNNPEATTHPRSKNPEAKTRSNKELPSFWSFCRYGAFGIPMSGVEHRCSSEWCLQPIAFAMRDHVHTWFTLIVLAWRFCRVTASILDGRGVRHGTVPVSIMEPDGGMRRAKSTGTGTGTVPVRGQTSLRRVGPSVELGIVVCGPWGLGLWGMGAIVWGEME